MILQKFFYTRKQHFVKVQYSREIIEITAFSNRYNAEENAPVNFLHFTIETFEGRLNFIK